MKKRKVRFRNEGKMLVNIHKYENNHLIFNSITFSAPF